MLNVQIERVNGILVTTSNRVADELGVLHKDLLEKIDNYLSRFNSAELSAQFYIPSIYRAKNGRKVKNYLITKKGIAQLIGGYSSAVEKAFELNVAYINKFDEMEKALYSKKLIQKEYNNIREMDYDGTVRYTKAILNDLKSKLLAKRTEIDEKIKELDRTGLTSKMQSYVSKGRVVVFRDVD